MARSDCSANLPSPFTPNHSTSQQCKCNRERETWQSTHLLPLVIILQKRVLASQLVQHLLCILLRRLADVGVGEGGLVFVKSAVYYIAWRERERTRKEEGKGKGKLGISFVYLPCTRSPCSKCPRRCCGCHPWVWTWWGRCPWPYRRWCCR